MSNLLQERALNIEESKIDYKKIFFEYLKHWSWFCVCFILAISIAYFKLKYTPYTYITTTKVKILSEEESNTIPDLTDITSFVGSKVNIENEIAILTSYRMMEKVVKDQKLTQSFFNLGTVKNDEIENVPFIIERVNSEIEPTGNYVFSFIKGGFELKNIATEENFEFNSLTTKKDKHTLPFELTVVENGFKRKDPIKIKLTTIKGATLSLQGQIKVSSIGKSSDLLNISMKGVLKNKSERILNSLVKIFGEEGIEEKRLVDKNTIDFIDQRFVTLAKELDTIEVYKKEFKQKNELFDLESDARLEIEKDMFSEEELFKIENQLSLSKMLLKNFNKENKGGLLPNNLGIDNLTVNGLLDDYNSLVLRRSKLLNSGGENNPGVKLMNESIEITYMAVINSIQGYISQLKETKNRVQKRNIIFKKSIESFPLKEKLFREIQRKQEIKESLFLLLLEKRETSAIKYAVKEPVIKVVDYALTSNIPASPNKKSIYLLAIFLGLMIPFSIIYLASIFNTKIKDIKDLEVFSKNQSILGTIPLLKNNDDTRFKDDSDRSILRESFRTLLTNVKFILPKKEGIGSAILITSSIKGEGKTMVSYGLASEAISHSGRVILIGADLRNPQLHRYLKLNNVNKGLSIYLHDDNISVSDLEILNDGENQNLDILLAGSIPPNPTSLFSNGRFEQLILELKQKYDYIIIDSAPTLLVSDTLIFSHIADTTVYVTRSKYTEKQVIEYSKKLVEDKKLNNVGYVLNGVDTSTYGYGYNYEYAYTYGYTYSEDDESQKKWYQFWKRS
ncbi:GumC family protein [Wenyingzhuangia sp. IMCC45574]